MQELGKSKGGMLTLWSRFDHVLITLGWAKGLPRIDACASTLMHSLMQSDDIDADAKDVGA